MSLGSDRGVSPGAIESYPLLIECDSQGQVLWMSEQARVAFGAAGTLLDTVPHWHATVAGSEPERGVELCYTKLFQVGERVLVALRFPGPAPALRNEGTGLLLLQGSLIQHYFRLQRAEKNLSSRARRRRPRSLGAVRQLELERQRIGRELHTSVGQMLSAIRLQGEIIAAHVIAPVAEVRQALDRIGTLTADALAQVRAISKRLHPPEWQRLTLPAALEQLWELSGIPQRFDAALRLESLPREPELESKVLLYRAAQEAISNLIRHSRATRVEATLSVRGNQAVLVFRDNGVGFETTQLFTAPPTIGNGIGLRSIREQAEALGGTFMVESGPNGTTLEVSAPFSAPRT